MVDKKLAQKANEALKNNGFDKEYHVFPGYISESEIFDRVNGVVIYVGCGIELSTLFLFENAPCYIHQDLGNPNLPPALKVLEQEGIISDLNITSDEYSRRETEFLYKGKPKRLIEVHGGPQDSNNNGTEGDIAFNVPDEVKQDDLEAIYFNGMPYPHSIRVIQINLLPLLKIGGLFEGPYPYCSGEFEGAPPDELGLEYANRTFVKVRHITSEEIQEIIGYSINDYIDYLLKFKM